MYQFPVLHKIYRTFLCPKYIPKYMYNMNISPHRSEERLYSYNAKPNHGEEILIRISKIWSMQTTSGNTLSGRRKEMCNTYIQMNQTAMKTVSCWSHGQVVNACFLHKWNINWLLHQIMLNLWQGCKLQHVCQTCYEKRPVQWKHLTQYVIQFCMCLKDRATFLKQGFLCACLCVVWNQCRYFLWICT